MPMDISVTIRPWNAIFLIDLQKCMKKSLTCVPTVKSGRESHRFVAGYLQLLNLVQDYGRIISGDS